MRVYQFNQTILKMSMDEVIYKPDGVKLNSLGYSR
jgi:hypothetical protein